jgi:hypothetical protein
MASACFNQNLNEKRMETLFLHVQSPKQTLECFNQNLNEKRMET